MILNRRPRVFFKAISACVAGVFLFQQIAWAGDFLGRAIEKQQREQSQTFGPSYIQGRHNLQEDLIKRNQDTEDFSRLSGRPTVLPKGRLGAPSKESSAEDATLSLRGPRGGRGGSSGEAAAPEDMLEGANMPEESAAGEDDNAESLLRDAEPVYEYDGLGRITKATYSNGDFLVIEYWGESDNKFKESHYKEGWVWQYAIAYYEDGATVSNRWRLDTDASAEGDAVRYDYDTQGRLTNITYDNGGSRIIEYWGTTTNRKCEYHYGAGWAWEKSIEYWESGNIKHKEWALDEDPSSQGNQIYTEYDELGRPVFAVLDSGNYKVFQDYYTFPEYFPGYQAGIVIELTSQGELISRREYEPDGTYSEYDSNGVFIGQFTSEAVSLSIQDLAAYLNIDPTTIKIADIQAVVWPDTSLGMPDEAGLCVLTPGFVICLEVDGNIYAYNTGPNNVVRRDTYSEYDNLYRKVKTSYSNGDFTVIEYIGTTTCKKYEYLYGEGWEWKRSVEYADDGVTLRHVWVKDGDPAETGDIVSLEYDSIGRLVWEYFDDGSVHNISYYGVTFNIYQEYFCAPGWDWQWSKEYQEDGKTLRHQWIKDQDPSTAGDEIFLDYDTNGRLVYQYFDDGSVSGISYYGDSGNIYQKYFCAPGWVWQWSVEYYEDGVTLHKRWQGDQDLSAAGDVIYIEYDSDGIPFFKAVDTGAAINYTAENYYNQTINQSATLRVKRDFLGQTATFKYVSGRWVINSVSWKETLVSWNYDSLGQLTGYTKTLPDGTIKVYDPNGNLIEKKIPSSNFITGANLPWISYGYDMAGGFSSNIGTLYAKFEQWKGSCVRVFLFCDLRKGINFDASGNPISFDISAFDDFRALLAVAKTFNMKLIPTLFDFHIANNVSVENGNPVGEHPDLISDPIKKQMLLDLFGTFFEAFAGDESIYAWDIMNEPEYASAVSMQEVRSFVKDFVDLIHSKSQQAKVTVGSARRDYLVSYWQDVGLDIYQYHYYDKHESDTPLDVECSDLDLDKPIIAGELQPTYVGTKLDTLASNGYAGGLFWQDSSFTITEAQRQEVSGHFVGTTASYTYYASGRLKNEIWASGTIREFEDVAFYKDGTGRLINETVQSGSYTIYQYYSGLSTLEIVTTFSSTGKAVIRKEYDSSGGLASLIAYYDNGQASKESHSDGTYRMFDEAGSVVEEAVKEGSAISVRNSHGGLLRHILEDGTIKEYSASSGQELMRLLYPDGRSVEYYYDYDGSLLSRYEFLADGSFAVMDASGNIVYSYIYQSGDTGTESSLSVVTASGDTISYKDDKIVSIERKADGALITGIELDANGDLKNARVRHSNGTVDIICNNSVVETIFSNGTIVCYRYDRRVFEYSKTVGYTRYYYTEDAAHEITSVTAVNAKAICSYDKDGLPVKFERTNGEITEYENGYLRNIIDSDGSKYEYTITTDPNPSSILASGAPGKVGIPLEVLYSSDGSKRITSVTSSDGTVLSLSDGILRGISGLDTGINVGEGGDFSFDDGNYKRCYDENGNLKKITTSDNTDIYFNNGEISEVISEDGSRTLYTGGRIGELYDKKEGATYESDSLGRITKVTYDSGAVFTYHYDDPLPDGSIKVTITNQDNATEVSIRIYDKDGLLIEQTLPSGIISTYTYEASGERRILSIAQVKNGQTIGSYVYEYLADKTLVTDINQNTKEYGTDGDIRFMYTPEGYVYQYALTDSDTLIRTLIRWDKGDGVTIYYKNGDVDRVETVGSDGKTTVLKDVIFDSEGKLKTFTVILPTGESRRCTVYEDGWSEINTSDTKLIYKDDPITGNGHLVAVNYGHRLFMFDTSAKIPQSISIDVTEDPAALDYIDSGDVEITDYMRQKLLKEYGIIKKELIPNTLVPGNRSWQKQSNDSTTLGISSVSSGDTITLQADINGSAGHSQGEAFLDLTIDEIGHTVANPCDFDGKTMSFYVKLEGGTLPADGSLVIQAFAKDSNWKSEYSTEITITEDGAWYKVELKISDETPFLGLKDSSFDPTQIRLVGLRVKSTVAGFTYTGQIYVKDANCQSAPGGEKVIDFPFFVNKASVQPYVGAIPDDQPAGGNPNYISWADIPEIFVPPADNPGAPLDLDEAAGRAQDYIYSTGVETVTRDDANNQWILGLDMKAGDTFKNDGEMYIDLRYDIPGYEWTGPIDLTGKTLTFKVKAPEGFIEASNSENNPMWAQVFVKDENYNYQYGCHVKIETEGQWITVTLIPQAGEIEEGNSKTSPDFDPSKIVNIGVKISCNKNSVSEYQGEFFVQNATPPEVLNKTLGIHLIDLNALKDYAAENEINITYEENLGPQVRLARQSLPTYFKDSSFDMGVEYYADGSAKSILRGNSRIEYYNTDAKLVKITDKDGATLVEYSYDTSGDITEIDYSGTRDSIRKAMDSARLQAQIACDETIMEMAEAKGYAVQYVDDTIKPALDEAYATRAYFQAKRREWEAKDTGWWGTGWFGECSAAEKRAAIQAYDNAIGQIDATIASLLAKAADMYEQIDAELASARRDIETQYLASLISIQSQQDTAIAETMKQEAVEVVDSYYKKVLGRNASSDEIDTWLTVAQDHGCLDPLNRVAFDASLVKEELSTNQVYIDEALANDTFISDVNTAVSDYLSNFEQITDGERLAALRDYLGLSDINEICYSLSDFDAILKYLQSNNKHFGKSAFSALAEILENNGKTVDLEDLAVKTILIDIFTGSITSITQGELEISIFALSTYAHIKENITLYNVQLDRTSLDALKDAVSDGKKAIVRVEGNHFIVVEEIAEDGTVTYKESSKGAFGEVMTMNEKDFLASWDGYAVIQKDLRTEDTISRVLTAAEAMLIRGSDIYIIFGIISIICAVASAILSFINNEICQMLSNVLAIVATVTGFINIAVNFKTIVDGFMTGLQNIGSALETTAKSFTELFKNGISGFVEGVTAMLSKSVIGISLNMSYNKALTTFGLNSDLAGITSAFLSGGFTGIGPEDTFSLTGAFTNLTIEGVRYTGRELGLDPTITNIIGVSAATIVSAGLGGVAYYDKTLDKIVPLKGFDAISYTMGTTVLPNVASELAYYGIIKLGEAMGIDDLVSQIAGIGIRSTISAGLRGYDTDNFFKAALGGLEQGIVSIGINYATQGLGLNPLLGDLGFSAISTALNAGIKAFMPGGNQNDVFKYVFDTYKDNVLTFLGYGSESNPWLQAAYISQILDFSDIVRQKGLGEALNIYGASFFNAVAVNQIVKTGYTLGGYFSHMLETGQSHTETVNGREVIAVDTPTQADGGHTTSFFDWLIDANDWDPLGQRVTYGDGKVSWSLGQIGKDGYQNMGYYDDATMYNEWGDLGIWQGVENTYQDYMEIKDNAGNTIFVVTPREDGSYNYYNSYGDYIDAVITGQEQSYTFAEDFLAEFGFEDGDYTSTFDLNDFDSTTFFGEGVDFDLEGSGWDIINTVSKGYNFLTSMLDQPYAYADSIITTTEDAPTGQYAIRFFAKRPQGFEYGSEGLVNMEVINDPYGDPTGHSFVALVDSSGNIVYRGLYPHYTDLLNPNDKINALILPHKSEIRNDFEHPYSESTQWYTVTQQQYNEVLTYLQDETYQQKYWYHLGSNNCTDLPLNIADMLGIGLPYADGPYSNPQGLADSLLEAEITETLGYSNFEILQETYLSDGHRTVTVRLPDGSTTNFTLLHK